MAIINPTIPTIGQPNATEDQDIITALNTIVAAINGNLDATNFAAGVISTTEIADNSITTAKLQDNVITQAKLQDNVVGNAELADNAVGNAEVMDNSIGNAEMMDNAITNTEVAAAAAIAYSKLAALATGQIIAGNGGVPTARTLAGAGTIGSTGSLSLTKDYRTGSVTSLPALGAMTTIVGLDTQLAAGTWFVLAKVDIVATGSGTCTVDLEYNASAIDHSRFGPVGSGGSYYGHAVVVGQVTSNGTAFTRITAGSVSGGQAIFSAWLAIRVA